MIKKEFSGIFFKSAALFLLLLFSNFVFSSTGLIQRPAINDYDIEQYKSQSAVILRHEMHVELDEEGLATTQTYVAILLNDETAVEDYSQLEITYNSYDSEMKIDFARVYNQGRVQYLKDDAITRQNMSNETYLFDNERVIFSLPSLKTGTVIELQYTNKNLRAVIPGHYNALKNLYWTESKAGGSVRSDAVVSGFLTITYPETLLLDYRQSTLVKNRPVISKKANQVVMTWQVSDLKAFKYESYTPEDMNLFPLVYVSTIESWRQINSWAYDLFSKQISQADEIKQIAERLLQGAKTDEAKIRAVFDFMEKNIRYVYAHVGRDGYEPHPALEVLENSYGDCKDQTVLAISILRAMGIDAYPALVSSSLSKVAADLPRNYFDHVFVYIPPGENHDAIWMDSTGTSLDFPGVHWSIENKPALILDNETDQLSLVVSNPDLLHKAEVKLSFKMLNQFDVEIGMQVRYSGLMGQSISSMKLTADEQDTFVRKMLSPIYPKAEIVGTGLTKIDGADNTYEVSAVFIAKDVRKGDSEPLNIATGVNQFIGFLYSFENLEQPGKRALPLHLSQAYVLDLDVTINNPGEGSVPVIANTGTNYASRYFEIEQASEITENKDVRITARLKSQEFLVPVTEYEGFYRSVRDIQDLPVWQVSYQQNHRALTLSSVSASISSESLEDILKNVEIYISNGEFSDALNFAERAIELDSSSAKAHYLRGVALGYKQEYEESNKAFERAMELGYEL